MSMEKKYPRKHTVRLSEQTSDDVAREAIQPDVAVESAVLMRQLIEEGITKRKRIRTR